MSEKLPRFAPSPERWAEVQSELAAYKERAVVQDGELAKVTRERGEVQGKLAAAEADEATCHCGQRLSQHYTATEHAAVEMSHPCPYSERLAAAEALLREVRDAKCAGMIPCDLYARIEEVCDEYH